MSYVNKLVVIGRDMMNSKVIGHSFVTSKAVIGVASPIPNYLTLYAIGNRLILSNQDVNNDSVEEDIENGTFKGDYYDFDRKIVDIIRKYPLVVKFNDDMTFTAEKRLVVDDLKFRTFYVKLENGELYEVIVSNSILKLKDDNNNNNNDNKNSESEDIFYSDKQHMLIKKIKEAVGVVVEAFYGAETSFVGYEYDNLPTIKTGNGTAPVIQTFEIDESWVGINYYPNPHWAVFLGFSKAEFLNAVNNGNAIPLYLISMGKIMKVPSNVFIKKAILVYSKDKGFQYLYLTDKGKVYLDDKLIGQDDIGIYWTEIKGVKSGCIEAPVVKSQYKYLSSKCHFSNPTKARSICNNGWGGIGKPMGRVDNSVINLKICSCKFYQETKNYFDGNKIVGIPVYYDNSGKLCALSNKYSTYLCDGSNALSECDTDLNKETIEAYDFYFQNKQKNQLLYCKSLDGYEFYEVPAFLEAPLRIKYQVKDKIKLTR